MKDSNKEIKCPHCGEWTNSKEDKCEHCGERFYPDRSEEIDRLKNQQPFDIPLIKIKEDDHWFVKGFKYVFRTGQMIFLFIVSVIAYIASGVAH